MVQAAPVAEVLEQAGLGGTGAGEIPARAEDPGWAARPEAQVWQHGYG